MPNIVPISLITVFSNQVFEGNLVAVVFLDLNVPPDALGTIARKLNQPVTSFVSPSPLPSRDPRYNTFGIRWFTSKSIEMDFCGHGTLAAAKAIFERSDLVGEEVDALRFRTLTRGDVTTRRLIGGSVEIRLPSVNQVEVTGDERTRLSQMVINALGKDHLVINYIGKSVGDFGQCLLIVLNEKENLTKIYVKTDILLDAGFSTNIVTTASPTKDELFLCRFFSSGYTSLDEDHVSGFEHCLTALYWSKKQDVSRGQEIKAKQAGARGGSLKLVWEPGEDVVTIKAESALLAKGDLNLGIIMLC